MKELTGLAVLLLLAVTRVTAGDRILVGEKKPIEVTPGDNRVIVRGLTPDRNVHAPSLVDRDKPWSLPQQALAPGAIRTINCLVLRFNFQYETTDDPNTTGRGLMNLATPLANAIDSAAYMDSVGHLVDPPPHDSLYYDRHMRALSRYWETVSEGKIDLSWDVFPAGRNTVYQLPNQMNHYGKCSFDSVVFGLEQFFVDCIQLADTTSPEINFADYEAIFLFHAGSDRQNDIGFPQTCSDLFTGFILFGDSVVVDSGTYYVRTALMMPETAVQDNRATALNAVLAHEFGHQLGLVDLYSTATFMTQLGDFALMDNNGFGTGIDFGYPAGRVFGAIPLFPCAWSRAYLGFVDVVDFRRGTDVRVVAAEVVSDGIKIARVPVSENEYYLIENRLIETDNAETAMLVDSQTYVFQGPVNRITREFTGEYDFLLPGSGLLIFHVDEGVAGLNYDEDALINFDDNDLQWDPERRFIRLVEADGQVAFGGYYRVGFGSENDMFRDDRATSFTPNTNPRAYDNSGNNTRVYITGITRDTVQVGFVRVPVDSVILFDVDTDKLASGFPVWAGRPRFGLSPIADDLDGDGTDEIVMAADDRLLAFTTAGSNFICELFTCDTTYYDRSFASVYPDTGWARPLPLYARTAQPITAGPATGRFGDYTGPGKLVAAGFRFTPTSSSGRVVFYAPTDNDGNALADSVGMLRTFDAGFPVAISFGVSSGDVCYALTSEGWVYRKDSLGGIDQQLDSIPEEQLHGICRVGSDLVVLAGDTSATSLYYLDAFQTFSFSMGNHRYNLGPIAVDANRDNVPEVAAFSTEGRGILVTLDVGVGTPLFSVLAEAETGFHMTTNPVAADVDNDGYADIVIGGINAVYAFNYQLTLKTDFPIEPGDRYPSDPVVAAPVVADIQAGYPPEIIFPTFVGNVYSYGEGVSYGFPLSGGEIVDANRRIGGYFAAGSSVALRDSAGGKLGYLGADGWFYLWEVDADSVTNYWPMNGHDPAQSFAFSQSQLLDPREYEVLLPEERFYNYPNPVTSGETTVRFFLGKDAMRVDMKIFDLSGVEITTMPCPTTGGIDHEMSVNCANMTPGVYRCIIEADFGGQTESIHTDMAVIR